MTPWTHLILPRGASQQQQARHCVAPAGSTSTSTDASAASAKPSSACGRHGSARALFAGGGPAPDVVSWSSMFTGNAQLGLFREATTLFLARANDGAVVIGDLAAATAFAVCARAGDLALARELH